MLIAMLFVVTFFSTSKCTMHNFQCHQVPIWDANKVTLKLHKISENVYLLRHEPAETETQKEFRKRLQQDLLWGQRRFVNRNHVE